MLHFGLKLYLLIVLVISSLIRVKVRNTVRASVRFIHGIMVTVRVIVRTRFS